MKKWRMSLNIVDSLTFVLLSGGYGKASSPNSSGSSPIGHPRGWALDIGVMVVTESVWSASHTESSMWRCFLAFWALLVTTSKLLVTVGKIDCNRLNTGSITVKSGRDG
ncbi:hypothetical protein Tco_0879439 [Tanacetum coccineum]